MADSSDSTSKRGRKRTSRKLPLLTLSEEDLAALRRAHRHLEHPSLAARLTSVVGTPIEEGLKLLPRSWFQRIHAGAEGAIRKMTSFPAQRFGLMDRGVLRPGAWADIVVFDLERIRDRATNLYPHTYPFENYPHRYPEGIDYVLVNGVLVVEGEQHTAALPGQVLRRS